MGLKAKELVTRAGLDVNALIKELNSAYCDEWLAYYQYWIGAQIAEGKMSHLLAEELTEHAGEELEHAEKLAKRIIELGGTPSISPDLWLKESTCGFLAPKDPQAMTLLKQNIQGERCAIEVYQKILEKVAGKDYITEHIIREILEDEIEHEQDLEDLSCSCSQEEPKKSCVK
ncbi:MAG: ferritin [Elusimicrobiaceae bacterium]|nr:ferritin [Elusimicrobiaceae bacterium]